MTKQKRAIIAFFVGILIYGIYCMRVGVIQNDLKWIFGAFYVSVVIIASLWARSAIKKRHLMVRHSL